MSPDREGPPEHAGTSEADQGDRGPGRRRGQQRRAGEDDGRFDDPAAPPRQPAERNQQDQQAAPRLPQAGARSASARTTSMKIRLPPPRGAGPAVSASASASVWSPMCWSVAVVERGEVVAGAVVAGLVADRSDVERQPAALDRSCSRRYNWASAGRRRSTANWRPDAPRRARTAPTGAAFGRLVSNMLTGPRTPRASRLIRLSTLRLSGSARKARAPTRPSSSPSLNSRMTGRLSGAVFQHPADFQQGRDAHPVIAGARADGDAVVMRVEQHALPARRAENRDDVADPRAADAARLE